MIKEEAHNLMYSIYFGATNMYWLEIILLAVWNKERQHGVCVQVFTLRIGRVWSLETGWHDSEDAYSWVKMGAYCHGFLWLTCLRLWGSLMVFGIYGQVDQIRSVCIGLNNIQRGILRFTSMWLIIYMKFLFLLF